MQTPHYLRFVRALALVAGAGCSDNGSAPDASPDVAAKPDVLVQPDVLAQPDAVVLPDAMLRPDVASLDVVTPPDVLLRPDVIALPDVIVLPDVVAEVGLADAAVDANPCPETPPVNGASCARPGTSCRWDMAGGGFTSCSCADASGTRVWSCATAVPGPLPPPELLA